MLMLLLMFTRNQRKLSPHRVYFLISPPCLIAILGGWTFCFIYSSYCSKFWLFMNSIEDDRLPDLANFCHFGITLKNFCFFERVLLLFGPNFELSLANLICHWANFHCCKGPNIKQIIQPSGHTDRSLIFFLFLH